MRLQVSEELVEAARAGEPRDIERLLEFVWQDAYRLAHAVFPQKHAAEDAAQEACVIMFRGITALRKAGAFATWFYRIVVREALKQKKAQTASAFEPDAAYTEDASAIIDLWRALEALPDAQRTVVVLHYFESLTSREIGCVLHIPHATVRFRLMSARRRLQRLLQEHDPSAQSKGSEFYAV